MESQEVIRKQPIEYLKIFFRCKWLLIVPTFAGLVLGIVASFMLPPIYESSTMIMIEEEKIINPLIQGLAVSSTAAQRMANIREIILGWNSLIELTKKMNLVNDIQDQSQLEAVVKNLRQAINVRMRQENIIQISYHSSNPQKTQLVTKTLADILMEKNVAAQTKEAEVAIKFIQEQLTIYKRKIKESEIANLEDELKKLLVDSTEMHPMVKDLRYKIAAAKKELDSGEYEIAGAEQPLVEATRQTLQKELDNIIAKGTQASLVPKANASEISPEQNAAIYKLLLMDKADKSLAQDIDVNKNIYQMLLEKLETAKITQRLEASKIGTRYNIIDPPRVPLKPINSKIKLIFIGFIIGAFCGTGLVFGKEFLDHSFLDIEDAQQNLELPVLGAISRITTQEAIDAEKKKEKKLIKGVLITSAALIFIAMIIALLKR